MQIQIVQPRAPWPVRLARTLRWAMRELSDPMVATGFGGAYKGAEVSRPYMDWITDMLSPDQEARGSLSRMRSRGHYIARNTPEGSRFCEMLVTNVVGHQGFSCHPKNRGRDAELLDRINKVIREGWYRWAESKVTLDRELTLVDHLQLASRAWAPDGELFARRWTGVDDYGLAIEPIDPGQVDMNFSRSRTTRAREVRLGIEVDDKGRRLAYHLLRGGDSWAGEGRHEVVPAADMTHCFIRRRPNQTRGITMFAPVLWVMKQLMGYTESELIAARIAAAKMIFFTQTEASGFDINAVLASIKDPQTGLPVQGVGGVSTSRTPTLRMSAEPGIAELLPKGVDVKAFDPQHPNTAYGDFVKSIKRDIASGVNVSYNAHANNGEAISFSTARDFANRERDDWRVLQFLMARQYVQQIFNWWLEDAVMTGRLDIGSYDWQQFTTVTWMPRGWRWVDPPKDIQYAERAIALGLGSRTQFAAELGLDYEEILEERKREEEMAAKYGVSVAGLAPGSGAAAAAATDPAEMDPADVEKFLEELRDRRVISSFSMNGRH